jgi:hypothetical protein
MLHLKIISKGALMYKINRIALILCLLESFVFAAQGPLPPKATLLFDVDDVIIQKSPTYKIGLVLGGIYQNPLNSHNYLNALSRIRSRYTYDADGVRENLCDAHDNPINGLESHFLYHGAQDNGALSPYVPWIVQYLESSNRYIDGTRKIILRLIEKGHPIAIGTNKGRISFDLTEQAFGPDFSKLATHKFVAHPGIHPATVKDLQAFAEQNHVPACYKEFLQKTLTVQPTDTIHHVPTPKPDINYYRYACNIIGSDKDIFFIDDKLSNVTSYNTLQNETSFVRQGIQFNNPIQLASDLVKIGILSETEDRALLEDVRYPGILGKIKLCCHKIIALCTFTRKTDVKDLLLLVTHTKKFPMLAV